MNILITGATGFTGSHLCRELLRKGYGVFGLSRSGKTQNIASLLHEKNFHLIEGDIRDMPRIRTIIKDNDVRVVFHLAAQLPQAGDFEDPFLSFEINAKGTLNMLHAAYLRGVEKFIYGSSIDVYSEPPKYLPVDEKHPVQPATNYGVSKLEGELYCNLYSKAMNVVVLRYSIVYGMGQRQDRAISRFINQTLSDKPLTIHGDGTQANDFVYVGDVVQAYLLALETNKPGIYNIGSGEEISVLDLAKKVIKFTKSKSGVRCTGTESNRPFRFALDINEARMALGYSPHSLNEGLLEHIREVTGE